ncbi:MAG: hypothetical protein B0W54_00310 [Cellvibrio sp. 79]|nr:MAG: hypothetical protein B0W54_00310 [Cellvibrio sp. 79]
MINVISSIIILFVPVFVAGIVVIYCWRQGWSARIALFVCAALISLHTHAYYFPAKPLKDRYANTMLKTSP